MATDYSSLKTEIVDFLARDDLTTQIDTFIDLAESRLSRELETRSQDTRTTLTTSADNAYVSLPTDMRSIRNVKVMNNLYYIKVSITATSKERICHNRHRCTTSL